MQRPTTTISMRHAFSRFAILVAMAAFLAVPTAHAQTGAAVAGNGVAGAGGGNQALALVPDNAMAVLKVKSLRATSDKVAKLAQAWGLSQAVTQTADPLGALKQNTGINAGLDEAGDMTLVFMDPDAVGGKDNAVVGIVPVTDYKAFLTNFGQTKPVTGSQGVSEGVAKDKKPVYIANWGGKFAVIADTPAVFAKKPAGLKLSPAAMKEMDAKDICIYANMPAIRAKYLPKLQANRQKWIDEAVTKAENNPKAGPDAAKFAPVIRAAVARAIDLAESFLTDTDAATYGLALSDKGIGVTWMADFAPNSYAGKMMSKMTDTDASMLAGLPSAKYLFFGGSVTNPKIVRQMLDDLVAPVEKEIRAGGNEMQPVVRYLDAVKAIAGAQTGSSFGLFAPTGALGQESLIQFVALSSGDAAALKKAQKDLFESQQDIMKLAASATGNAAAASATTQSVKNNYTPNAKTLSGVTFDQFTTQVNINAQSPEQAQVAQFMTFLYGPTGLNVYVGQLDAKHLLSVTGAKDDMIEKSIASAKADEDSLGKLTPVQSVKDQLPKKRLVAAYVPLDAILSTGIGYAKQFGMPVNLQLPPDLPPIGLTLATEGNALRGDVYVPSQLVESIVSSVMQMMMEMRGGGAGGAGGPGAQPGGGGL